jgi:tRNA A37 threonylcarbamoyladenosine dehydratase
MTIIDGDAFDATNKNRQLTALDSTLGRNKAVVLAERIKEINPECQLTVIEEFVLPERVWQILKEDQPDYVMDCIDSVTPKLEWILACKRLKVKIISHTFRLQAGRSHQKTHEAQECILPRCEGCFFHRNSAAAFS